MCVFPTALKEGSVTLFSVTDLLGSCQARCVKTPWTGKPQRPQLGTLPRTSRSQRLSCGRWGRFSRGPRKQDRAPCRDVSTHGPIELPRQPVTWGLLPSSPPTGQESAARRGGGVCPGRAASEGPSQSLNAARPRATGLCCSCWEPGLAGDVSSSVRPLSGHGARTPGDGVKAPATATRKPAWRLLGNSQSSCRAILRVRFQVNTRRERN